MYPAAVEQQEINYDFAVLGSGALLTRFCHSLDLAHMLARQQLLYVVMLFAVVVQSMDKSAALV